MLVTMAAIAQEFPAKPIRFVVPYPPGGASDVTARVLGQRMSEAWGQQVTVDNRAGANGIVALEYVAKSPPDGYTISHGEPRPQRDQSRACTEAAV